MPGKHIEINSKAKFCTASIEFWERYKIEVNIHPRRPMSQHIFREFTKQSPIQLPSVCGTLSYCYAEQMSWKAGAAETLFPPPQSGCSRPAGRNEELTGRGRPGYHAALHLNGEESVEVSVWSKHSRLRADSGADSGYARGFFFFFLSFIRLSPTGSWEVEGMFENLLLVFSARSRLG